MRIGDTWGSIRGFIRSSFSFPQIKDIVGAAGLPVQKLSHLKQKSDGYTSKGELMDEIDGLVNNLDNSDRDRIVIACISEILERKPDYQDEIIILLNRVGWGVFGSEPYPINLQIEIELSTMNQIIQKGITF